MTANLAVEADGLQAQLAGSPPRFALRPPLTSTLNGVGGNVLCLDTTPLL